MEKGQNIGTKSAFAPFFFFLPFGLILQTILLIDKKTNLFGK